MCGSAQVLTLLPLFNSISTKGISGSSSEPSFSVLVGEEDKQIAQDSLVARVRHQWLTIMA